MTDREQYTPGPASGAQVRKDGEKWTLILVRELRHSPEKVWQALTDPAQLREWAPFDADGSLGTAGTSEAHLGGSADLSNETNVTRADAPKVLEYDDIRWELEPSGERHAPDAVAQASIAASSPWAPQAGTLLSMFWIGFSADIPWGASSGAEAMKFSGWQRLNGEYAKQFGVKAAAW